MSYDPGSHTSTKTEDTDSQETTRSRSNTGNPSSRAQNPASHPAIKADRLAHSGHELLSLPQSPTLSTTNGPSPSSSEATPVSSPYKQYSSINSAATPPSPILRPFVRDIFLSPGVMNDESGNDESKIIPDRTQHVLLINDNSTRSYDDTISSVRPPYPYRGVLRAKEDASPGEKEGMEPRGGGEETSLYDPERSMSGSGYLMTNSRRPSLDQLTPVNDQGEELGRGGETSNEIELMVVPEEGELPTPPPLTVPHEEDWTVQ